MQSEVTTTRTIVIRDAIGLQTKTLFATIITSSVQRPKIRLVHGDDDMHVDLRDIDRMCKLMRDVAAEYERVVAED